MDNGINLDTCGVGKPCWTPDPPHRGPYSKYVKYWRQRQSLERYIFTCAIKVMTDSWNRVQIFKRIQIAARYQSASGLRNALKNMFFQNVGPPEAMLHPDGLLGKTMLFGKSKKNVPARWRGARDGLRLSGLDRYLVDCTLCKLIYTHVWSFLFGNCWNMSFPMFV